MATIRKRDTGSWQVSVRLKGRNPIYKTFRTKAAAERWARETETEVERGSFISTQSAESTLFKELTDRYVLEVLPTKKSQRQVISQLNKINDQLGAYSIAALTPLVVAAFRDKRLKSVTGHSVRKDLLLIRRILSHAQKEWEIYLPRGNPIMSITIPTQPKGRDRRLVKNEEQRLLNSATQYGGSILHIIVFAIETGMRRGEISKLKWEHIDLNNRTATLYDTKNSEDRTIPLSTIAMGTLEHLGNEANGSIFSMKPDSITRAFERICKHAEIEGLRLHDLRHEATTRFFEKGLTIMEVSSITGHKDLAMLRRYTHLRAADLVVKLG
jgi:integrase